jgi:SAM-dependent methyltransferase
VVGEDLEARGHVLRCLGQGVAGLAPPARLVEFGPGWGNLTGELLATGYEVTAVDTDERFCELLGARHGHFEGLRVVHADMLDFEPDVPLDAAVFFERLHRMLKPSGVVLFAGEPVQPMAFPWGPRLDGLSLWSTRRYGWLELGFDPDYFAAVLQRTGWRATRRRLRRFAPKADVIVAEAAFGPARVVR